MTKAQLDRIGALSRKSRAEGLTPAEQEEQALLRRTYIDEYKKGLRQLLDHTYLVDEKGNKRRVGKK